MQRPGITLKWPVMVKRPRPTTNGYKAHINTDEDGFIKTVDYTVGNVHDSHSLERLLTQIEEALYADKAYASKKHDQLLEDKGIVNCILHIGNRNRPLRDAQKA